ncbi:hypothetical protein IJJ39_01825 [Candidatus Saccharibacteria bacterium]|nr:hypothetical protein [Candidatus Saccharibacteria bacterium]
MMIKKYSKTKIVKAVFGCLFAIISTFSGVNGLVFAEPVEQQNMTEVTSEEAAGIDLDAVTSEIEAETDANAGTSREKTADNEANGQVDTKAGEKACQESFGGIAWLVCPITGVIAKAVDWLYDKIEGVLVVNPVEMKDGSPIYEVWKYMRGITNIAFIIFLLVMVYSQITGLGITNYGLKKTLPKLIIGAILVNLSFIICTLVVDASNIIGGGLRDVFTNIEMNVMGNANISGATLSQLYGAAGGVAGAGVIAGMFTLDTGVIWMLIPTILGGLAAVVIGLFTIALRQAVVALLIMISPLAVMAYILPNTEQWFKKWKDLLTRMLVFYPMFSLLFGASSLAGFAIIASASDGFGICIGIAVQIFPLFFSWSLMKMSGTFLSSINARLATIAAKPIAVNRAWAESHMAQTRANALANGVMPSAKLMQYLDKRRVLRETDTKNALEAQAGRANIYVQNRIAGSVIGETTSSKRYASRYTRNAMLAKNYALMSQNATAHTEHVLTNFGSFYKNGPVDRQLAKESENAWVDFGRAAYLKEIDDENDINFLVDRYLAANKRDKDNNPVDKEAFNRYISSVAGPNGEQRLLAKVIAQASKVESKQRAEFSVLYAKYGHNGYNKHNFRNFIAGYHINDDGWAVDMNGKRLVDDDGNKIELVPGEAITKAPEKLVLYDVKDEQGLYYDFKDQDGNVIARVHRGKGADGVNHDDAAYIKESLSNLDIPIADPINNVYGILSGIKPGDVVTPQGENEIGLARYSTTIARAMSAYKENAAWSGSMFNSGVGNRQIKNAAQYAIWTLDSFKKTLKPGAFNRQNPASVEFVHAILDPDNWNDIFTEEAIRDAVNINNEPFGGEEWLRDDGGNIMRDDDGEIRYRPVAEPTYEQRMNTIKRKLIFPAMKKILPAFDRLRTSNTADNQKPGTADAQYEFLKMVEEKWENNPEMQFDPLLVDQDLQAKALNFRQRKHDKNGKPIYKKKDKHGDDDTESGATENILNVLEDAYNRSLNADDLKDNIFRALSRSDKYARALERFDELCNENEYATMSQIEEWFSELGMLSD